MVRGKLFQLFLLKHVILVTIINLKCLFIFFIRNNEVQFAGEIQPRGSRYCVEFKSGDQKVEEVELNA